MSPKHLTSTSRVDRPTILYSVRIVHGQYLNTVHLRSFVLGQTQDEASAYVSYPTGTRRILTLQVRGIQRFTSTNWRHPCDPYSIYRSIKMTGTLLGEGSGDNGTTKEQIEGYLSALRSLIKEHNSRDNVLPIRLNFSEDNDGTRIRVVVTGKEIANGDLKKPFKETANTTIDGWAELRTQFTTMFSTRRACFKDPTEITKIVRKPNETLVAFKERWIMETAKRYSDKVPKTMDEMMVRLDDFVRSGEAFANTKLPKDEVSEASKKLAAPLRRQLESALESGKLNHLIKDVRQRRRGNPKGRDKEKDKKISRMNQSLSRMSRKDTCEVSAEEYTDGPSRFRQRYCEAVGKG
uniref:Reverse transcriptase domain-containing protein n=1 Tax=Tanacetum cinerariifolium TaxID=118510 RepID=A0A6L2JUU0_TANCI|nr:hypothetical protein [Tanacetum cinerariifolium]